MSVLYPTKNRIFTDDINSNNRFYRESEAHAKIKNDTINVRNDLGFEKQIYEEMHDPEVTNQEIQAKLYKSE